MKKRNDLEKTDDLRSEYDLRKLLKGGVGGKYADRYREGTNLALIRQNSERESHFKIEKGLSLWLKEGATQTFNPRTKGHCR